MSAAPTRAASAGRSSGRFSNAWRTAWPWLFWAPWGAWLAVSDLRNDDVQPAVLLAFVGGAVLGFARPRTFWVWGLLLGAWVPAEPLVSRLTGIAPAWPFNAGAVLAFGPALLGAAAGAALARAGGPKSQPRQG